jgi:ABC-type transporter Mla MlaB component
MAGPVEHKYPWEANQKRREFEIRDGESYLQPSDVPAVDTGGLSLQRPEPPA